MIFTETAVRGAWLVEPEPHQDERGFFARLWCRREFAEHGLDTTIAQCSTSFNLRRGTLRGLHYQAAPHEEVKIVRCTRGAIYDVAVDLRVGSQTRGRHAAVELSAANGRMLYVPRGCAHGFQTLADDTEVFYQMSEFYAPESGRGVRWNDPAFGISWPLTPPILNARDAAYALMPPGGAR